MSYIKFEARVLGAEYWLELSPAAFTVHVFALSYCNDQATDGVIGRVAAERLNCPVRPADIPQAWQELFDHEVWVETEAGYKCPSFLAYGLAAQEQNETRDRWAFDKRRQRLHNIGNHSLCVQCKALPKSDGSDGDSDGNRNIVRGKSDDQTRPDQTRPDQTPEGGMGRGEGSGDAADSAGATSAPPQQKHHRAKWFRNGAWQTCCELYSYENNRHHYRLGECQGCDDERHKVDQQSLVGQGRPAHAGCAARAAKQTEARKS